MLVYAASCRYEFVHKMYVLQRRNRYMAAGSPVCANSLHNLLVFKADGVIHCKGSKQLVRDTEVVIPYP